MYGHLTGVAGLCVLVLLILVAALKQESEPPNIRLVRAQTTAGPEREFAAISLQQVAPPNITLIDGEEIQPADVMALTRFSLVEDGDAYRAIKQSLINATLVRREVNNHVTGYMLPVSKSSSGYAFSDEVKGWRAAEMSGVSVWPSTAYPAARSETMDQAASLLPIPMQIRADSDMELNLRFYYFPVRVGYDGTDYIIRDAFFGFFVHRETGSRLTALHYDGHTYLARDEPLSALMHLYVPVTETYKGPLGMRKVRVPSKFYAESLEFETGSSVHEEDRLDDCLSRLSSSRHAGVADVRFVEEAYAAFRAEVELH
jgi:hypothetical protein